MTETDAHDRPEPYPSLDALRQVNDELLAGLSDDDSKLWKDETLPYRGRLQDFLRRAVDTGILLDTIGDRRAAQGLIDYWASAYLKTGADGVRLAMSGRRGTALRPFDAGLIGAVARRGEEAIKDLPPSEKDVARWILLRLFHLSEDAKRCESSPAILKNLLSLGEVHRVKGVIDRLADAGVISLRSTDQGDLVELRYDALARRWDRLRDWIDARVKFREAALFWLKSGKDSRALLGAGLWKEAEQSGNLNDLEREFIESSKGHVSRLRYVLIGAAAALLVSGLLGFLGGRQAWDRFYVQTQTNRWNEKLKSANQTPDKSTIEDGFKWLARNDQQLNFPGATFTGASVKGIRAKNAIFRAAKLNKMDFSNAETPYADFTQSEIIDSNFNGTKLTYSRFESAIFSGTTSFVDAVLIKSIFDRALFCQDTDFSMTDVNLASFRYVIFDGDHVPRFHKSAWWLAAGWNMAQVEKLLAQTGSNKEIYRDSPLFKRTLLSDEQQLSMATEPIERAIALNGKAWDLATYGVDLGVAERESREAQRIVGTVKGAADAGAARYIFFEDSLSDTLAYILTQTGKVHEALEIWKNVVPHAMVPPTEPTVFSEGKAWIFRYAVALFADGQKDEAYRYLTIAMDEKKYLPSHELYLLWPIIRDDQLRMRIENLMKNDQPVSGSAHC